MFSIQNPGLSSITRVGITYLLSVLFAFLIASPATAHENSSTSRQAHLDGLVDFRVVHAVKGSGSITETRNGSTERTNDRPFTSPHSNISGATSTGSVVSDLAFAVGRRHIVQGVTSAGGTAPTFRIYSKANKTLIAVLEVDDLAVSNACLQDSVGAPLAVYDHLRDRFVLATMARGFKICLFAAEDASPVTTRWFNYTLETEAEDFTLPRMTVWDNAVVISTGTPDPTVYILETAQAIRGEPMSWFDLSWPDVPGMAGAWGALFTVSNLTGDTADGRNMTLVRIIDEELTPHDRHDNYDVLEVVDLRANWHDGSVRYSNPYRIKTYEFRSKLCDANGQCVFQPNGQPLYANERVLSELSYRRFSHHESLVGSFTVDWSAGYDLPGIRFFELRRESPTADWELYFEGLHNSQEKDHFLSSIALDQYGNLAMAYVESSPQSYPSLAYAGWLKSSQLGYAFVGDRRIGAGGQPSPTPWFGRFTHLEVDPIDQCLFWVTGQYQKNQNWATRIASFKHPQCKREIFASDFEGGFAGWSGGMGR